MGYKLGLDTGGTYTDAVIVDDESNVCSSAKALTTHHDLSIGLREAVDAVLERWSEPSLAPIELVSLSTTLATNALVEGKGRPIGLILIGYQEKQLARARLSEALGGDPMVMVAGGHDANGSELTPLDLKLLDHEIQQHASRVDAYAVSAMFATRNPVHEIAARDRILELTGRPVSCGHELSSALDAPRRALTAVLNARLIPLIAGLLEATTRILKEYSIAAPLMVVKGDGSLVSREFAQSSPVETILSGPAASVVGAQFLCDEQEVVISDIGGTTTDIALLDRGMPKLDPQGATVGGWRTMVQAVKIHTSGLGGDSAIRFGRTEREITVGPDRVKSLSLLCTEYPEVMDLLETQLDSPYVSTHAGQFVLPSYAGGVPSGLSMQQKELWDRIQSGPQPLLTLFEDQTLERAMTKLVNRGIVQRCGFTPTDASHILDLQTDWNVAAARAGAELLRRYSEFNLGPVFESVEHFATHVHETVARKTAMVVLESTLADHGEESGLYLREAERAFIQKTFASDPSMPVDLQVKLKRSLIGIGAPAATYYPRVGELLDTRILLPEHAAVANALGAVVGTVRQSQSLTITPAGGKRVKVHTREGPREFDSLDEAAEWAVEEITRDLVVRVRSAGAVNYKLETERHDNIVDNNGELVFFESVVTIHASGRPATAAEQDA